MQTEDEASRAGVARNSGAGHQAKPSVLLVPVAGQGFRRRAARPHASTVPGYGVCAAGRKTPGDWLVSACQGHGAALSPVQQSTEQLLCPAIRPELRALHAALPLDMTGQRGCGHAGIGSARLLCLSSGRNLPSAQRTSCTAGGCRLGALSCSLAGMLPSGCVRKPLLPRGAVAFRWPAAEGEPSSVGAEALRVTPDRPAGRGVPACWDSGLRFFDMSGVLIPFFALLEALTCTGTGVMRRTAWRQAVLKGRIPPFRIRCSGVCGRHRHGGRTRRGGD